MNSIVITFFLTFSYSTIAQDYKGSSFSEVWKIVSENPYQKLPVRKVGFDTLFDNGVNLMKKSAERTISDRSDILPTFKKLAHPNGICGNGTWEITKSNPYSGLFKKGTKAPIIARMSVALNEVKQGELRGFGFAGKIFPTNSKLKKVPTANFFLIDDLGGTDAQHYTDVEMTNSPKATPTTDVLGSFAYVLEVIKTFSLTDFNPNIRQVYQISKLEMESKIEKESFIFPTWMMIKANEEMETINEADFRNELSLENRTQPLKFDVFVSESLSLGPKVWSKIGHITINETVASTACDTRLHFNHPKWISNK